MGNIDEDDDQPPRKKKRWVQGVDMPEFSGRTWAELNDIWPQDVRVNSEIWKALSVLPVALYAVKEFQKALIGQEVRRQDLFQLMWVMRCEESKEDVATLFSWTKFGKNVDARVLSIRNSPLVKMGLIEQIPSSNVRLYRVTHLGRMILKNLVEEIDKAHQNIKIWTESQPDYGKEKVTKFLTRYCFNIEKPGAT